MESQTSAAAPASAKAANVQGGAGEFTFPPLPPLVVRDFTGEVPLPQDFPGFGESSDGSFSRVSLGCERVGNDLHLTQLEFPEDWEEDPSQVPDAWTPPGVETLERADRDVAGLMRDIFGSDDSHVGHMESGTASNAPRQQSVSSVPVLDQAASLAHADASAEGLSLEAPGAFASTAGVVDDALGSFVGGLVKQDVARFGKLDDGLRLPWESEFSKLLFDPDCVWDPLQGRKQGSIFPPITHNAQAARKPEAGSKDAPSGSIFAWAIALGSAARDPAAERERKREQGIGMWSRLVLRYSECCSLFECVCQGMRNREAGYEDVVLAVSAAVGVKSPHTIHKRAASFWTFVRWLDVHEPLAPSGLHEVQVWNFVQFLKETSAPASKAASVLSAFRFAHFVLGFRLSGIVDSRRIAGATEQQLVNVRKLRQAKDLTVSQVLELHARLESGALHCFDRVLLASLLIRLYARARPSDFLFVESVEVDCPPGADYPLLVFEVSQHKGARKVQLKTKLLPILVPMIGVHGKCWIDEALSAFRKAGRSLTSVRGPLTLAPADESGVVSSRRSIASSEVGKMLRAFLGLPEEVTDPSAPRVTAYSLRGTCLGWGGKFGFDEDLKSILGRHASSVKTTQAIYSRELSAAPVRRLQDMIREVAAGNFFPDNSRSSYFPRRAVGNEEVTIRGSDKGSEKLNPVKVEVVSSDESEAGNSVSSDNECSDSSQSSQSSSSSSASEAVQPAVRRWKRAKVEEPDQVWYVNTSSGVLHLLASPDDVPMLLACGRPVSGNYREATRIEVSRGKECRTCRRNVGLSRESLRALADHGIDTLSKLAYSCGQPGTPLPQSEFDDFISTVMPAALLGEKGSVKRLLFESQALLLNDLREQVTQPDKWSTRDVPTVERQKRMEAVRASIPGVVLEGSLEPSHGLLNAACRMEREGQLRYIAPEQCGTRMYEIQNVKAQSKTLSLEEGKLAISEEKGLPEVACGSALLLQEALKRRGVALQFAGVASYVAHERYVLKLFGHMGREPPPGYARTSVHQLLTADRQVWTRMIENEISPKRSADGTYPVDRALLSTLETFDVTVALLPRKSEESKKRVATPHKPGVERDTKITKPPKGKGKGKKGTWQPSVPEAIRKLGGVAETPDKKRICFSRPLLHQSHRPPLEVMIHRKLADVLQLITMLESETPARGQEAPNTFSWTSGAYAKGGEVWQKGPGNDVVQVHLNMPTGRSGHAQRTGLVHGVDMISSPRLAGLFVTPPAHLGSALDQFLAAALLHVLGRGAVCVLAQSGDGPFWTSDCWSKVSSHFTFVSCHDCAYEGNHLSTTIFAVTDRSFSKLARFCSGNSCRQDRLPESKLHGAHPVRLAMQIACCFAQHFVQKGWQSPPQTFDAFDPRLEVPMSRALAGAQPRASKIPPLVSEHQRVLVLQHPPGLVLPCQPMQRLRNPWPVPPQCGATLAHIPAKAQLLRHVPIVQAGGKELVKVDSWEMAWGLPWEPEEFMQKASESCHPRSMGSVLPAPLNDTLESLDKLGDAEVSALRARVIKEWLHLATSLSSNEAELKASMHPDVREITASKRILLWEALLKKYDYPDQCVSSLLKEGVPLVGHDPALAAEVCSKTDKEREAGWIVGPLCESSLCDGILVSRRFGIQQGQKVRCIDNLTSSGVNLAVQAYEAPQPQSTDVVASTCLRLLKSIKKRAGKVLFKILGKAFDLTAAYRQMPVHPDTAWAAYVCFVHPDTNERVYFRMKAMPFGSAMAVYAFLRISHSLWFLGAKALLLPWSSFFDDFVTFATTGCSASAEAAVTSMFKLLGWAFAESGEKANDFSECFQALGIMVDLRACLDGTISFKNTAKRVSEIRAFVGKVLESGRLPHHEALRLRGRCQFADSQIFGRTGKKCLGLITAHAYGFDDVISRELRASLEKFLLRLEVGAPRLIKILEGGSWHVYTDASYEPGAGHSFCGLGGVLVDPTGVPRKFFSLVLSDAQKNFLGEQNSAQIIFQAEMLAMAVALDVWLQDLMGHTAIFFVDNNGVRDAAISANARASVARRLLEAFLQKEHNSSIIPWFARVPSPSNPADEPSRVELDSLSLLGVQLLRSNVTQRVDSCLKDVQGLR
ncbi:unnamed protein product [Symbiodinium sp. CCMP2592]|nr:unnamed protein product [Symbiodinium sp. CCMP2592]